MGSSKLRYIVSLLLHIVLSLEDSLTGKLSSFENSILAETCGKHTQSEIEYEGLFFDGVTSTQKKNYLTAISSRHIIVDAASNFLNFKYDTEKCKNNVIEITSLIDHIPGMSKEYKTRGHYIGSCDGEFPRGFVVLEYHLQSPKSFAPVCLSEQMLEAETTVQVFTTQNVTNNTVEYIYTKVKPGKRSGEVFTDKVVRDFGGPVFHPNHTKKTYVGHAYENDNETIFIVPIFQYLQQICDTTGVCIGSVAKNDANSAKLSSPLSSFIDVPNEPTEPVINVSFVTSDTYKNNQSFEKDVTSEIIDLSEIEGLESEPEKESSGEEENEQEQGNGNVIFYESSENKLEPPKFLFMPMAPEDELLPSAAPDASDVFETTPSSKTIVHAEPYSVVIIPLSEQEEGKIKSEDFPSSTELLIAFLISLSLFFYVCMCLYGFVDYKGIPVFWKVDLGVLPV